MGPFPEPNTIKKTVTGQGKGSKDQVAMMVMTLLPQGRADGQLYTLTQGRMGGKRIGTFSV